MLFQKWNCGRHIDEVTKLDFGKLLTMEEPFPHVVASLAPHTVKAGQVAEVELKPGGVWPVRVLAVCGPLLEVRPLGSKKVQWFDSSLGVWPWRSGKSLAAPADLGQEVGDDGSQDWRERLQNEVGDTGLVNALPAGQGNCPVDSWR